MASFSIDRRLAALNDYAILDTPREVEFDDVVMMAREAMGAPMAAVSLVAEGRQWFKAESGIGVRETPIGDSVCALALQEAEVLVIPDCLADPRLATNTLVHGPFHLRAYAGAVLKTPDGVAIGALCVLDTVPREWDETGLKTLRALARLVMTQLEYRRALAQRDAALQDQARSVENIRAATLDRELALDAAQLGRWDHRPATGERFFDRRAREILGLGEVEPESLELSFVRVHPDDQARIDEARARAMSPERTGPYDVEMRIVHADGAVRWVSAKGRTSFEDGVCTRFIGVLQDINERKVGEERRILLTNELNHRVKNSLALAQAVVDASLRGAKTLDEGRATATARIRALSHAHDILTSETWSSAAAFDIVLAMVDSLSLDPARIVVSGEGLRLGPRAALQLSLALHELATNASKYGALTNDVGKVFITWSADHQNPRHFHFAWQERGGPAVVEPTTRGFGSRLIERATAAAFEGEVKLAFDPEGVLWTIDAPLAGLEEER